MIRRNLIFAALVIWILDSASAQIGARATTSRFQVAGGIYTDIEGSYPPGFKPGWAIVDAEQRVPALFKSYITRSTISPEQTIALRLGDIDGSPGLLIEGFCVAIISRTPIFLTRTPAIFVLSDFRNVRSQPPRPGCARQSAHRAEYRGAIRLATDAEGNLIIDLDLSVYSSTGSLSLHYEVNGYVAPNRMTPLMVRQELDRRDIAGKNQREAAKQAGEAFAQLRARASTGNVEAMRQVGLAYLRGAGTSPNEAEAIRWLSMAANAKDISAAFTLAGFYNQRQDHVTEARWYRVAAALGSTDAMYNLGVMAKRGQGMPPSLSAARTWMRKAAELGMDDAIRWLKANDF